MDRRFFLKSAVGSTIAAATIILVPEVFKVMLTDSIIDETIEPDILEINWDQWLTDAYIERETIYANNPLDVPQSYVARKASRFFYRFKKENPNTHIRLITTKDCWTCPLWNAGHPPTLRGGQSAMHYSYQVILRDRNRPDVYKKDRSGEHLIG